MKFFCWIGLHSWTIYHRTAFNDETPRRVEKAFECSCCGKMKPTNKDGFV